MNDNIPHFVNRLESGLRLSCAQLQELVEEIAASLPKALAFGRMPDTPAEWQTNWRETWESFDAVLRRIGKQGVEVSDCGFIKSEYKRTQMLSTAKALLPQAVKLREILDTLQIRGDGLKEESVRNHWRVLARLLEADIAALQCTAQSVGLKLELLVGNVREKEYQVELRNAAIQIENEQHRPGNVLEAMFMWVETDEERANKDRALREERGGS